MKPLSIALALPWLNNGTHANFIGDHGMACAWQKYLLRRPDVAAVNIFGERIYANEIAGHDVVVHFWPWSAPVPGCRNVLYLQSALSAKDFGVDTVGAFQQVKERFDGFLFVSDTLRSRCGADGCVVPFAADPEQFTYQPSEAFQHAVSFVGSDIRGDAVNEQYLAPALAHGLVIYGGPYRDPKYQAVHRGRLSAEDLPKVFSSSRVNLNLTIPEHAKNGVINERVYQVLACGGTLISDGIIGTEVRETGMIGITYLPLRDTTDWESNIQRAINWGNEVCEKARSERREMILQGHTTAHRVETVMQYLKEIL